MLKVAQQKDRLVYTMIDFNGSFYKDLSYKCIFILSKPQAEDGFCCI